MGVKDLLGKILLAHPDQYTPEHLLKPENYQKVEKNCLSPPSNIEEPFATANLLQYIYHGKMVIHCTWAGAY